MNNARAVPILAFAAGWLLLFAVAIVAAKATGPTGDGFTRGLNRVGVFLQWQLASVAAAGAAALLTRRAGAAVSTAVRRVGYAPLVIDAVLVALVVLLVVGSLVFN